MDNQHKLITGYRDLNEGEIKQMNEVKRIGETLGVMLADMRSASTFD
ncbi:MAG: hypothetical protein Q7J84_10500 [Sulfuricaulis sp.]|nr:hypothetical protein [Sulfuricaulis sp.]